jgi:hypothetical protein
MPGGALTNAAGSQLSQGAGAIDATCLRPLAHEREDLQALLDQEPRS